MKGPTHRQYSICFAVLTAILLYRKGITEINYYLSLPILLMAGRSGALFPDVDHTWQNVSDKTYINKIINTIIHITGGKHRSWQTQSWDICLIFTMFSYFIPNILFNLGKISAVNREVMCILLLGFSAGWVSHLFSDMLTSAGVRVICFSRFKIALVPKKIGSLKFNTGHEWESFNFKVMKILNFIIGIFALIYPIIITKNF